MTHIKQFLEDEQLKGAQAEVLRKLQIFESELDSRCERLHNMAKEYHCRAHQLDTRVKHAKLWLSAATIINLMWSLYLLTR
jgi:hypothetical protein